MSHFRHRCTCLLTFLKHFTETDPLLDDGITFIIFSSYDKSKYQISKTTGHYEHHQVNLIVLLPTENALWGAEEFLAAIPGVATESSWKHGWLLLLYPVLNDTFTFLSGVVVICPPRREHTVIRQLVRSDSDRVGCCPQTSSAKTFRWCYIKESIVALPLIHTNTQY